VIHERRVTLAGVVVLLAVLTVAAAVGCLVLGPQAGHFRAVMFAAAVAGSGAVTGWLVARQGRGRTASVAVAGGLAAIVVRMVPMLVALGWLVGRGRGSWEGVAGGLLVAFHLILLGTDMVLHSAAGWRPPTAHQATGNRPEASADIVN